MEDEIAHPLFLVLKEIIIIIIIIPEILFLLLSPTAMFFNFPQKWQKSQKSFPFFCFYFRFFRYKINYSNL
jgi:hypothetical protein